MQAVFTDQVRLLVLIVFCGLLWSLESIAPLYRYQNSRLRHALPNVLLTVLLVLTNLALSFSTAYLAGVTTQNGVGLFPFFGLPFWIQTIVGVLALDLFAFLAHVLLHKSWLGWQFHRVHHSEKAVDVTTAFRQHPGETLWRILWQLTAIVLFGIQLQIVAAYLVLSAINAQMEHANITLPPKLDRILRLLFVTPDMHKVHHSRNQRQTDSNYSNIFSFWDRLFGSYTPAVDFRILRYGLDGFDAEERQSLRALLKMPFVIYRQG